ncbi:MAG: ABC transporter ATP-binding protein, partial [Bacteroidaceae bacterium]|nr:ABC transporter ATP-binding protein [Bacteroidaceae bacterium]
MIQLDNIRKVFRTEEVETIALGGVTMSVNEGEFVAIMGPSGCGKSTLLNILGLLDNPCEGSYKLAGTEVADLKERDRTQIRKGQVGFVFQSFNLIDELNVEQNVELPLKYVGVPKKERNERIDMYGEMLGITDALALPISEYSHGMKQKVAIISALVHAPKLILMDEPFVGLDPSASHQLKQLMKKHCEEGGAIFFSTHVLEEAEKLCHKVAIIKGGNLVASGTM